MTNVERDKLLADLLKTLQKLNSADPVMSGIIFFREVEAFIDKINEMGRLEGFNEGYKEAKRKLEREYGKLN
jgi:hypothetical protein